MSVRENIELDGMQNEGQIVEILIDEFGTAIHPRQANAYVLDSEPFNSPRQVEDHISVLSFNNTPLPYSLIEALEDHLELFPDELLVRWTQEQDLIFEATLGQLRGQSATSAR